ncbi:hypothetical protein DCAR_0310774 [Daucus carota subsp. sativus]|uniref:Uncharacterized protein n=1 Tax=Daucus carota subsp. sativus TaxID=79200 RepID=A0A166A5Y6_DAUCS|nr:PREDICTED: uncharacterized protein LOC108213293 [Daucus carota subsp. sativus]WOG91525.1 hypothetical protein DCAR_0310774 [Daucus carota subsp. sativus]
MSRMMRSDRKPPLARSPIRLRSRRNLQSATNIPMPPVAQTPIAKPQIPKRTWDAEELEVRPEYNTISCELRALAKMVQGGHKDAEMEDSVNVKRSPLFERGRFYEEYSARRNERLRRKKGGFEEKKAPSYDLGVRVSSAKKTDAKKQGSVRKSVPATPVTERGQMSRYSLRSSSCKENNKPPVVPVTYNKSVGMSEKKVTVRKTRKL